ncbi:MAG: hypothetical protein M1837_003802 [Sclerophora amabilis]|nr:MAG: hypothetical protein M1837_003802 [Sclerophora amabilis]
MFGRPAAILSSGIIRRRISPRAGLKSFRAPSCSLPRRSFASKSEADSKIEEIQELNADKNGQFEIATEETEKKSLYAKSDREAAREELGNLKEAYNNAIGDSSSGVGDEIKKRIGQRLRELEAAVEALNKADYED